MLEKYNWTVYDGELYISEKAGVDPDDDFTRKYAELGRAYTAASQKQLTQFFLELSDKAASLDKVVTVRNAMADELDDAYDELATVKDENCQLIRRNAALQNELDLTRHNMDARILKLQKRIRELRMGIMDVLDKDPEE